MYYELYIDVLFMMNFMMDSLLLLAVKRGMGCQVHNGRVFLGAAVGAALACLVVAVPLPGPVKILVSHAGVNILMLRTGLGIRMGKRFWQAFGLLYAAAFIMGGILQALRPWMRTGSFFFAASVGAYYLLCGIWKGMLCLRDRRRQICDVALHAGGKEYQMLALLDTGNTLLDPVSGEPVSVLDPACAQELFRDGRENMGIRYIPCHTVAGKGIMPVFRADEMEICLAGEKKRLRMTRPVIGICEGQISEQGNYQMILNPDILERI